MDDIRAKCESLMKEANRCFQEYHAKIEADLQEWVKVYPIESMTIIRGNLPKGVIPLREYAMETNEGHIIDRLWLVHNCELKGIVDEA